jgi:hypothetical protein
MEGLPCERTRLWVTTLAPQPGPDPHSKARERLRDAYLHFRERVATLTAEIPRDLPDFTVHDVTHLDALWEMASLIAGESYPLTPAEAFVLGGAILLHDAGMGLVAYPGGKEELRKSKEWDDTVAALMRSRLGRAATADELRNPPDDVQKEVIGELLRNLHAKQAEKLAHAEWTTHSGEKYRLIEQPELREAFGHAIGEVAHSHWWSVNELRSRFKHKLGAPAGYPAEWTVDTLKVACLLRVADASHVDSRRAPGFLRALRSPRGSSDEHWQFQQLLTQPQVENERLKYTASRPFSLAESNAWWLCADTLQMIDRELRQVDALLADTGRQRLAARSVANVEEPVRLSELIPTKGWTPVDARVRVTDVLSLVERLGGERLYGRDPKVPLRELIQNASDAVRARRLLQGKSRDWGEITVRRGQDEQGSWLEVEDNGIGMTEEVLTGALLDFGKIFWHSREMRRFMPGLEARGFNPTGRYGIGFFSVFMWGDHVRVTTRWCKDAERDTRILEFKDGLSGRPLVRPANEEEWLDGGGTRVRVWMREPSSWRKSPKGPLAELCGFLGPTLDVNLYSEEQDEGRKQIVVASDWKNIDPKILFSRINGGLSLAGYEKYSSNLRELRNPSGEVVGRACIIPELIFGHPPDNFAPNPGVITAGGLRACTTSYIAGVLEGAPVTAARDVAIPVVDDDELGRWASEQAELLYRLKDTWPAFNMLYAAMIVRRCGGDVGNLPVAWCRHGWIDISGICEHFKNCKEVLVLFDAQSNLFVGNRKISFESEVLCVSGRLGSLDFRLIDAVRTYSSRDAADWPRLTSSPGGWQKSLRALDAVIVESLSEAWSTTVSAMLEVSTKDGVSYNIEEREVGSLEGKPLRSRAWIIQNPRASRGDL